MSPSPPALAAWVGRALGIARTQYLELTRQPVFGVTLAFGMVLVALSPALAVFSIGRAEALVLDLGASAALFFCVFLAATAVAAGAADRLSDGTTTLVLTHPIGSVTVLVGQLLGASLALGQAALLMTVTLLCAVRNGPDQLHLGVVLPFAVALAISLGWGIRASLARKNLQAAVVEAATLLLPLAFLIGLSLDPRGDTVAAEHFRLDPMLNTAVAAGTLTLFAALPFAALGLALSTRLGAGATAALTLLAFLLASLVQGPLAPPLLETWTDLFDPRWLTILLPDLQLYWIGDAAYTGTVVSWDYVAQVALTSGLYVVGALGLGGFLLEGRELGKSI
jgi:ABC-type transport system involved in multi-copper enzyme maturation permease subunit